jgi:CheY-like chemotaxis protein
MKFTHSPGHLPGGQPIFTTMSQLKRILLVEDSPRDAEMTIEALSEYNLANSVTHCRDGAEALDYLHGRGDFADRDREVPVVVLLDLKMPKIGGMEVLREMKRHPTLKNIPVVVMTSSREEQDVIKSYELGVNAYVVKPVRFPEFAEAIKQLGIFWAVLNEVPAYRLPDPAE